MGLHLKGWCGTGVELDQELDQDEMPAEIQRQWYLHDKIREFCPVADQDITCPEPSAPRPDSTPEPPGPTPPVKRLWTVWPTWPQQEELHC